MQQQRTVIAIHASTPLAPTETSLLPQPGGRGGGKRRPFARLESMRRLLLLLVASCLAPAFGQTVVVLPFFNLSGSANLDWIGESVAETIRETLAAEGILVFDRDSRTDAYRRLSIRQYVLLTRASVIKLGEALDAERVVYGSFNLSAASGEPSLGAKSSLQLATRVLDLRHLQQSAEESATGALEDLAEIQDRLAWQTMRLLLDPAKVSPEGQPRRRRPVRLDALESYIRGLLATSPDQKHRFFTQAARLDEGFVQPCFELGRLLWSSKDYRIAAGWLERVKPGAPHYMEASFLLGLCRYHLGEYEKAQSYFWTVVQSVPLNEVWNNLGAAQSRRNLPEAVESFRKAIKGDPGDATYHFNLGYALWKKGEFESAAGSFRTVLNLTAEDPEAVLMLGRCLKKTPPQRTELRIEGLERLKSNFEEMAYRQLRATLQGDGK
jgi:tetratricopeptide (TPR) repeat protein